jgi:hypothetical protein
LSRKIVKAFSLSSEVVDRLEAFTSRLRLDPELAHRFSPQTAPSLIVDKRGLVPTDYDTLRKFVGSSLDGDALMDYAVKSPATRRQALSLIREAIRRNAKLSRARSGQRAFNLSKTVEVLLTYALGSLEADAAPTSIARQRSRKSRDARKAA